MLFLTRNLQFLSFRQFSQLNFNFLDTSLRFSPTNQLQHLDLSHFQDMIHNHIIPKAQYISLYSTQQLKLVKTFMSVQSVTENPPYGTI